MSSKFHLQDGDFSVLEQVDVLFKRNKDKVAVDILKPFYQETLNVRPAVLYDQIWSEPVPRVAPSDLTSINPETALDDEGNPLKGSIIGLTSSTNSAIKRFYKLELQMVPGSNNLAYYYPKNSEGVSPFQDVIPFNYDPNGTYEVFIYRNPSETRIPFGLGEWDINHEMATITFFEYDDISSDVNQANPPLVSFYKYVGNKGVTSSSGGGAPILGSGSGGIIESSIVNFNNGDGTCGDGATALAIDTERGPLSNFDEGQCSYALQFGPNGGCGSWRIITIGNGDGTTSLHFQYRTNLNWISKFRLDPEEIGCEIELGEGEIFNNDGACGSWRIHVVSNGDGSNSLHFQYRTLTDWVTKFQIDPEDLSCL